MTRGFDRQVGKYQSCIAGLNNPRAFGILITEFVRLLHAVNEEPLITIDRTRGACEDLKSNSSDRF